MSTATQARPGGYPRRKVNETYRYHTTAREKLLGLAVIIGGGALMLALYWIGLVTL